MRPPRSRRTLVSPKAFALGAALGMLAEPAGGMTAAGLPPDPLASPMWSARLTDLLGAGAVVRADPRLLLIVPDVTEDQRNFPLLVDARALGAVRRMVILVDLNPLPIPLDVELVDAEPVIGARIRLDQRTPVRALAQLADGSWVMAGIWVSALGGGCSMPSVSRARGDWADGLGRSRVRAWSTAPDIARLRLHMRHPMDTGFVENVPAYHVETIDVRAGNGRPLARLRVTAGLAEDPTLTLHVRARPGETVRVDGQDSAGIRYAAAAVVETDARARPRADRPASSGRMSQPE